MVYTTLTGFIFLSCICCSAGKRVVVVESRVIGAGMTGRAVGDMSVWHTGLFSSLERWTNTEQRKQVRSRDQVIRIWDWDQDLDQYVWLVQDQDPDQDLPHRVCWSRAWWRSTSQVAREFICWSNYDQQQHDLDGGVHALIMIKIISATCWWVIKISSVCCSILALESMHMIEFEQYCRNTVAEIQCFWCIWCMVLVHGSWKLVLIWSKVWPFPSDDHAFDQIEILSKWVPLLGYGSVVTRSAVTTAVICTKQQVLQFTCGVCG